MVSTERTVAYIILVVTVLLLIFVYLKSWIRCVILALKLKGPKPLPILGNVLLIGDFSSLTRVSDLSYKTYGKVFRAWISVIPAVFVLDPKDIQIILGSSRHTDKSFVYSLMHNFIGRGLISNSGYKWRLHRRLIQPYFNINILDLYTTTFWQSSSRQIKQLETSREVNINNFVNSCVLDILHETILGIGSNETTLKAESPYRKGEITASIRIQKPWFLLDHVYKFTALAESELKQRSKLYEFTKKILNLKRDSGKSSEQSVNLMQYFMEIAENNTKFDDDSIINELCTFMLAGQDSVAAAVSFTLYNLAAHQSIQEKAYIELYGIFKNSDRPTDVKDLQNMKYIEQCIKETMRLYPSVPIISRKLSEDIVLGKHTLPAGCNVFISPYTTHRLEQYYENPHQFNPDRFSTENLDKLHPYAYLPFSAGPRNCIGYKFALIEIKMIVSTLLRRFHLSLCSNKPINLAFRITLRASGGIWLKLSPRE
ncbi:Cytochrome P450 [Popillia japonica]|uniref:Cytochrome P450 n=1 Tax=Popillia japonica TaxID=7064 RepID=A0AAW1KFF7_POPJA